MFLIVGLGNPGASYERTRHNAGFLAVDKIIAAYDLQAEGKKFHAHMWKGMIGTEKAMAIKPQTFMNKSGVSVSEAARFFKIPPEKVLVLYDELDLIPGKLRIKQGGGHGGHNGLRDIDRVMGKDYWRLRLGIGHPGRKEQVTGYVLGKFSAQEQDMMDDLTDAIARDFASMMRGEHEKLMTSVAHTMQGKYPA